MPADPVLTALSTPGHLTFAENLPFKEHFESAGGRVVRQPTGHLVFYRQDGRRILATDPSGHALHESAWGVDHQGRVCASSRKDQAGLGGVGRAQTIRSRQRNHLESRDKAGMATADSRRSESHGRASVAGPDRGNTLVLPRRRSRDQSERDRDDPPSQRRLVCPRRWRV